MKPLLPLPNVPACDLWTEEEQNKTFPLLKQRLQDASAVLVSHYYVDEIVQAFSDYSGGFVGDSLAMAAFGASHEAQTLIVAGVRFMAESAKILSPEKRVLALAPHAECSLDLSCPIDQFDAFCQQHPDRTVVVYANTSVEVKARADWIVTSSNARKIIEHLHDQGEKILWAPDRHLGGYLKKETGADMLLWQGECIVHDEYSAQLLKDMMRVYPDAAVLVHPEAPASVVALASVVGSTRQLLDASISMPHATFIVATDRGLFYKMRQASPSKQFLEAPTAGQGATCRSCGHCPWMAMNALSDLDVLLSHHSSEVRLPTALIKQAQRPLERMLSFNG